MESNSPAEIDVKTKDLPERSEFELKIAVAREMAISMLPRAQSLTEFMMLTNATRRLDHHELASWVDEVFRDRKPEAWLQDNLEEIDRLRFEMEASYVATLRATIGNPSSTDAVGVALMKVEEAGPFETMVAYRALAVFPRDQEVSYDVPRVSQSGSPDEVYIDFSAPCNEQAAAAILGENQTGVFEVENFSLEDLFKRLGFDFSLGAKQNFKYRDEAGDTVGTRDPKLYVLFAVKGGYANEKDRYLVSDFSPRTIKEPAEAPTRSEIHTNNLLL